MSLWTDILGQPHVRSHNGRMGHGALLAAIFSLTAVILSATGSQPAVADSTGMDSLHAQRKEGRFICMSSHFHEWTSNGFSSRKAALAEAVRGWEEFTNWEYGSDWAYWSRAASRKTSCSSGSGGWSCSAVARPCRPPGRRKRGS